MDLSAIIIIIIAAVVSILANVLKVWEFGSSRFENKMVSVRSVSENERVCQNQDSPRNSAN
jgi:flagellar basal body-associated protein FliL